MTDLTDFLLARIAEDEGRLPSRANLDSAAQRRLRAECEAKRRIVDSVGDEYANGGSSGHVLRALALPYADHPDYREEWRP